MKYIFWFNPVKNITIYFHNPKFRIIIWELTLCRVVLYVISVLVQGVSNVLA